MAECFIGGGGKIIFMQSHHLLRSRMFNDQPTSAHFKRGSHTQGGGGGLSVEMQIVVPNYAIFFLIISVLLCVGTKKVLITEHLFMFQVNLTMLLWFDECFEGFFHSIARRGPLAKYTKPLYEMWIFPSGNHCVRVRLSIYISWLNKDVKCELAIKICVGCRCVNAKASIRSQIL